MVRWTVLVAVPAIPVLVLGSAAGQEPAIVGVTRVHEQPVVETVRLTGTVTAPLTSDVSTEIASRVLRTEVQLADRVSAGDPLVSLDSTLERLQLKGAEATAAAAAARLADAERRVRDARQLVADNTLPRNELASREATVRVAEAEQAAAEAEIQLLAERVERHVIRAPFDGAVTARLVEAGEWVEPGTSVVQLVAVDQLFVDVPVPERYFPRIGEDFEAELAFRALGEARAPASIEARVPMTDPTARSFLLRLKPVADGLRIAPGMAAVASLSFPTGQSAVVVPRDALIRYPDGRVTVWVVERGAEGATVTERHVTLGEPTDGGLYVIDGLTAGSEVVTHGNESLSPGQRVQVEGTGS